MDFAISINNLKERVGASRHCSEFSILVSPLLQELHVLGLLNQQNSDPMTKYFVNTQFPELSKKKEFVPPACTIDLSRKFTTGNFNKCTCLSNVLNLQSFLLMSK